MHLKMWNFASISFIQLAANYNFTIMKLLENVTMFRGIKAFGNVNRYVNKTCMLTVWKNIKLVKILKENLKQIEGEIQKLHFIFTNKI